MPNLKSEFFSSQINSIPWRIPKPAFVNGWNTKNKISYYPKMKGFIKAMLYREDFLQIMAEQRMKDLWAEAEHRAMVQEAKRAKKEATSKDKPGPVRLPNIFMLVKNYLPVFKQS